MRHKFAAGVILLVAAGCVAPSPPSLARPRNDAVQEAAPGATTLSAADLMLSGESIQGGLMRGKAPADVTSLQLDGIDVPIAADRRFIIAFDRDAKPAARLIVTSAQGQAVIPLSVAPRAWNLSRLSSLPKYPVPDATFAQLRPPELAQIGAARAIVTDAQGWRQTFRWPATGRISTLFGSQRIYANGEAGSYHSGIDIAVPQGTPVFAPADGVVILATDHPFTLEGNLLMVDHGMGLNSAFMHLSKITVALGDHIRQGQVIAYSGKTGRATGPHLHWGLKWLDARIDPLLVAGPMPSGSAR